MRALLKVLAVVHLTSLLLCAQSYRGVQVGQRGDLLPPQFSEVKTGELSAQFGNERVDAYVNGALVTGLKVVPFSPITLAEAVAKHGSTSNVPQMLAILDGYGEPQGIADPQRRIAYITQSLSPDSVVSSVGYYDTNASLLLWLDNVSPALLQAIESAAKNVSVEELNNRPRTGSPAAAALFLVSQAVKRAQTDGQNASDMVKAYAQSCSDTPECKEARQQRLTEIRQAMDKFHARLVQAEDVYSANADLLNRRRPPELDRTQQLWNELAPRTREFSAEKSR